ncbi:hypothetical protein MF271_11830 [Deinococcus sp. KNUC1210]|uniref:hypothetical protein n=1 Tax=Deinococcus sp. KNUC1210 TaxID=2917691 RepID=UPI001EEF8AD1|nr:hypothetical protein [Deinococcus sp. KNUC1210]ULH14693.1 hypothetical protein MF271_11830 [Deinococcus sp. KNUC1210]
MDEHVAEPAAWAIAGLLIRADTGSVTLSEIEKAWEGMYEVLEAQGLRLAATRALPISQDELESRNLGELLFSRLAPDHPTPPDLL